MQQAACAVNDGGDLATGWIVWFLLWPPTPEPEVHATRARS